MNIIRLKKPLALGSALWCSTLMATSDHRDMPGLVLLAEQRFNPTIQRLLARQELKLLPIANTQMFLIIPQNQEMLVEEMQIRYLQELIDRLNDSEPESD